MHAEHTAVVLDHCEVSLPSGQVDQLKHRAVATKHTIFQASSQLRAARIRLDEDVTLQQMQQRQGLSTD